MSIDQMIVVLRELQKLDVPIQITPDQLGMLLDEIERLRELLELERDE